MKLNSNTCGYYPITFWILLIIQSSLLISAEIMDYPSFVNAPNSWGNTPSSYDLSFWESTGVKPILVNGMFVCGFHCSLAGKSCLFAVAIFNTTSVFNTSSDGNSFSFSPPVVWSANRNNPVEYRAQLQLTPEGGLILKDGDGVVIWSANRVGKSISRLNLSAEGNLMLFDKTNNVLWQSFDYATDSLVRVQRLVSVQKLEAKVQNSSSPPSPNKNLSSSSEPEGKRQDIAIIMGSTLGVISGVFLICIFCFLLIKKGFKEVDEEDYLDSIPGMPTRFSFEELKNITKNFSNKLGEGGFGSVYRGTLASGSEVAVKHLDGFGPVNKSFIAEVQTIGSINHFNLVSLVGFCAEKYNRLLVYEYMCKGSLDQWIFHKNQDLALGWQIRKKIILDIAKGLAYLHEECNQKIIHLDIKPQNILLDENFNAKVSDFGLSKLIGRDQSKVVTTMRGTPGYMAPEWLSSIITEKVDVYSFGIVVLEILCGRKNVDGSQQEEDRHLLSVFGRKQEEGQLADLVDKCSEDMQSNAAEVVEMMKVVAWCLQAEYAKRPSMSTAVKVLEGSVDLVGDLDDNFLKELTVGKDVETLDSTVLLLPSMLSGPR